MFNKFLAHKHCDTFSQKWCHLPYAKMFSREREAMCSAKLPNYHGKKRQVKIKHSGMPPTLAKPQEGDDSSSSVVSLNERKLMEVDHQPNFISLINTKFSV